MAAHLAGEWVGEGVYEGSRLELTRRWSLELYGQFLRGDMRVSMPNGASFGAYTYWRSVEEGLYEVVWLDASGRMQTFSALRNPESGAVSATYLDERAENGAEWRRWVFQPVGPNSYVERLHAERAGDWVLLTEFRFERAPSP